MKCFSYCQKKVCFKLEGLGLRVTKSSNSPKQNRWFPPFVLRNILVAFFFVPGQELTVQPNTWWGNLARPKPLARTFEPKTGTLSFSKKGNSCLFLGSIWVPKP